MDHGRFREHITFKKMQEARDGAAANQMATRWCFTLNNPTEAEEHALIANIGHFDREGKPDEQNPFNYIIFEKEHTAPGSGTPHLQGFFKLKQQKQLKWIRRHIPGLERAHLEVARGTDEQNRIYCTKEGIWVQEGGIYRKTKNAKGVWDDIRDLIEGGATAAEIRREYPAQFMSRMAGITQWILEIQAQIDSRPVDGDLKEKNIWVWGPPGTGKSRWAHGLPGAKYMKLANKWWDGYNGQPVVIMEDLDPTRCQALAQHLKIWADRYPFTAEVKGGHRPIRPEFNLVVTSNYHPDSCFQHPEDAAAIRRRFTICQVAMEGAVPSWPPVRVEVVREEEEEEE